MQEKAELAGIIRIKTGKTNPYKNGEPCVRVEYKCSPQNADIHNSYELYPSTPEALVGALLLSARYNMVPLRIQLNGSILSRGRVEEVMEPARLRGGQRARVRGVLDRMFRQVKEEDYE